MYTEGMTKTISTHITALISGATSILALIHPGFTLNPAVQGVAVAIPALIAGFVEVLHFIKTHDLKENLAAAEHFLASLTAQQVAKTPAEPTTETAPKA